jgi:putative ABC transport system substrate-binding protein
MKPVTTHKTLIGLVIVLLATNCLAESQQPGTIYRIGYLGSGAASSLRIGPFRQGLRDLGWVEGKNFVIEARWAEGRFDRVPDLATELLRLKVDVIVWSAGIEGAKQIKTVPVIFVATTDPVSTGLVETLARPGGNVTGLTSLSPELTGKRLELLKQCIPKLSRVGFLFDPANASNVVEMEQLRGPAAGLGITIHVAEARNADEIERAFSILTKERAEGLSTASGGVNNFNRRRIVDMAAKNRLPAVYHLAQFVDEGGLMSYGPNLPDMFRRAAYYVDKILKGAKPAELPVQQPTNFELVLNLKTAKHIGLTIPPHVLARADRVIK